MYFRTLLLGQASQQTFSAWEGDADGKTSWYREVSKVSMGTLGSSGSPVKGEARHVKKHLSVWGRKQEVLRQRKPLRLIRDGEVGGREILHLTPTRYTVTT